MFSREHLQPETMVFTMVFTMKYRAFRFLNFPMIQFYIFEHISEPDHDLDVFEMLAAVFLAAVTAVSRIS